MLAGAGESAWLLREAELFWRESGMACGLDATVLVSSEPAAWFCDAEDDVRWCRRAVGMEKPEPDNSDESAIGSCVDAAEVEDVLDTTEAFWAARRRDSSRVSRFTYRAHVSYVHVRGAACSLTTASCSFWSSM